jgi:dynein heavy chain 1
MEWFDRYQAQPVVLTAQIIWTEDVEGALGLGNLSTPVNVLQQVESTLTQLADCMQQELTAQQTVQSMLVLQRTVIRDLARMIIDSKSFQWLCPMWYHLDLKQTNPLKRLSVCMANAKFNYRLEYLDMQDRLVQTPMYWQRYLTMTQALKSRHAGLLFGPAGTGKSEHV